MSEPAQRYPSARFEQHRKSVRQVLSLRAGVDQRFVARLQEPSEALLNPSATYEKTRYARFKSSVRWFQLYASLGCRKHCREDLYNFDCHDDGIECTAGDRQLASWHNETANTPKAGAVITNVPAPFIRQTRKSTRQPGIYLTGCSALLVAWWSVPGTSSVYPAVSHRKEVLRM